MKFGIYKFTLSRYLIFILQLGRGFLLARFLGPFYFGIFGFLLLIQQYLVNTNFGVNHALNVKLSTKEIDLPTSKSFVYASLFITTVSSLIFIFIFLICNLFSIRLFEKYLFSNYFLQICIIVGMQQFQLVFSTIFRVYQKFQLLILIEFINIALPLTSLLFYEQLDLLNLYVFLTMFSSCISFLICIIKSPIKFSFKFNKFNIYELLIAGIPLMVYNLSTYLISLIGRTTVSINYSQEILGYFSFATSISIAIMFGLDTVSWALFPKILNKLKKSVINQQTVHSVNKITEIYSGINFLIIFSAIVFMPLIFTFLNEYSAMAPVLTILLLSQGIIGFSFGFCSLAIARNKQNLIAVISFLNVILVLFLCIIDFIFMLHYIWVAVIIFIGSLTYTISQILTIKKNIPLSFGLWKNSTVGLIFSIIIVFIGAIFENFYFLNIVGMSLFLFAYRNTWKELPRLIKIIF